MATQVQLQVRARCAVLDADGHVVVMFGGANALAAGREWADRGYLVVDVDLDD